jgi:hypothetical protein
VSRVRLEFNIKDKIRHALLEKPEEFLYGISRMRTFNFGFQWFVQPKRVTDLADALVRFRDRSHVLHTAFRYKSNHGPVVVWTYLADSLPELVDLIARYAEDDEVHIELDSILGEL